MRLPRAILLGMLAVTVLDILEPIAFYGMRGVPPARILQSVAGGLLGREQAVNGGAVTAALGLALHAFIASTVVVVYWRASRKLDVLARRPVVFGIAYGLAVYLVMTFVVVPASAIGGGVRVPPLPILLNGLFAHVFCVGLPAAGAAKGASRASRASTARV